MKKILLTSLCALLLSGAVKSQTNEGDIHLDSTKLIYTKVEKMPQFKDRGEEGIIRFLHKNIKYPSDALGQNKQGIVYVSFVISEEGKVEDVKMLSGICNSINEEAMRVVRMMPDWEPGYQNGKPVRVQFNLPINFKLGTNPNPNQTIEDKKRLNFDFYNKGVAELNEKNYNGAISLFNMAIFMNSNDIDSYYNRGVAHRKLNHNTESCSDWNKCKELGDKQVLSLIEKYCK